MVERMVERTVDRPLGLVAELTHRCPLHCPYCSNPLELVRRDDELRTEDWLALLSSARALGVLQLHLTGGEPALRRDLADIVRHARSLDLYSNLVTSGVGLSPGRLSELVDAGLDHVQLSIQDSVRESAEAIAGLPSYDKKLEIAALVGKFELPLTVNVVLHRGNVDRVGEIAALAASLGADRLELAHTQYYGWGQLNQSALVPTRAQVDSARVAADIARARFGDSMQIVYVLPDLYETRPKPCMYGWGARHIIVNPRGDALPCTGAAQLPGLSPPNVRDTPLDEIWYASEMFNAFRGTDWMPSPCRSCEFREKDFGGCRCQAFQLLGDATATDPVCEFSPDHAVVLEILSKAAGPTEGVLRARANPR